MTQEIMKRLQAPFPSEEVEWRTQSCGISNGNPWAMVLCYIQARAIQKRLDEVFGWDGWTEEYRVSDTNILCRLGVKTADGWIYKENGASNTDIEAFKGGISGAFKRVAASGYGIGRYLYNLEESFAECSLTKQTGPGWHTAKTKDKTTIWWKEPQLPKWALPEGSNTNPNTLQQKPLTGQINTSSEPNEKFEKDFPDNKCADCGEDLIDAVITFCQNNKDRFHGKNYCKECQKKYKRQRTA